MVSQAEVGQGAVWLPKQGQAQRTARVRALTLWEKARVWSGLATDSLHDLPHSKLQGPHFVDDGIEQDDFYRFSSLGAH